MTIMLNSLSELPNLCWHFDSIGCGVDCKACTAPKVKVSVPQGRFRKGRREVDAAQYKWDDRDKPWFDDEGYIVAFGQQMCPKLKEALYE